MKRSMLLTAIFGMLLLNGCLNQNSIQDPTVQTGAVIGAVTGAVIGGNSGNADGTNIAIGTVAGAVLGATAGDAAKQPQTQTANNSGWHE